MRLLIIRHGEPDYAHDTLTEKGWSEAELLSRRLEKEEIEQVFCSPLGRAQATAKPYLEKTGKSAETLDWLQEFNAYACLPGSDAHTAIWNLRPQFWTKMPELFNKDEWLDGPFMSSGNVAQVREKTASGLNELLGRLGYKRDGYIWRCENNRENTVALFCHFGLAMAIIGELIGISYSLLWQGFFMPTSSVTTFVTEERVKGECYFKCQSIGDTSHLYAAGEPVSKSGLFPECFVEGRFDGALV